MKKVFNIIINKFFGIFKINNSKIVFQSNKNLIDGNPHAIYEYMKKNYDKRYRLIWILEKNTDTSIIDKKDFVYYKSLMSYFHLATAKYWIRSQSFGSIIKKRKSQIYIQTWHGHGALKKMSYDINNNKNMPVLDHVKEWDYFISTDELDGNVIRSSTGYQGKILNLGAACLDLLVTNSDNNDLKSKIKNKLNISKTNKKIVLYAPTFREKDLEEKVVNLKINKLKDLKDYIILIRLHPLIKEKIDKSIFRGNFVDACNYPDVSDLLLISDVLITDYSSIVYEYALLNRPIIMYAYDYDEYKKERGFYINYNSLPGPILNNEKDLYAYLNDFNSLTKNYKEKLLKFNQKYNMTNDGNSTKRIVDKIVNNEL